jgi:flagellar basal body rod protein FlgG
MKPNGLSSAASALRYWERRQEIAANNLANVSTTGFKGERVFARAMEGQHPVPDTATDLRPGALQTTGAPLDLAMGSAGGFFVVETTAGERWSRGGSFQLDARRRLVDASGNALLGVRGPVTLPEEGEARIARDGTITVDGREVDRLRVENAPTGTRLTHDAGTLFLPADARAAVPPDARDVRQGALEESNVGAVDSMVDLIAVHRAYASVQKAVTTIDDIRGTISNDLGKPV